MATEDVWRSVLTEALAQAPSQPLRGTSFRSIVDRIAAKHDTVFPPPEEPGLRFVQLLQRYPDIVTFARRPGQDMLVVQAGRTDLLAAEPPSGWVGIRADLFAAFTQVQTGQIPLYDKDSDRVVWLSDTSVSPKLDLTPIPPTSLEAEIQLRKGFIGLLPDGDSTDSLNASIKETSPLFNFGREIREHRLQQKWHSFRTERVKERIQKWAAEANVTWRDAWLTTGRTPGRQERAPLAQLPIEELSALLSRLETSDLQRISIPLDLVLKALRAPSDR